MNRFFTDELYEDGAVVRGEDVKHIVRVLRLGVGDTVRLCDGKGRECEAKLSSIEADKVVFVTEPWRDAPSEPVHRVTLLQGLPKAGKMELILQKGVELGAAAFVPLLCERCVVQPDKEFDKRLLRYRRVCEEAAKQSGRGVIPEVLPLVRLSAFDPAPYDNVLVAYEDERETSLKSVLRAGVGRRIAVLIGPEGGFAKAEIERLGGLGAVSVSLGRRILRTETAGMALLAQLLYELE